MHELSLAVTRDLVANGRPFASVSLLPQGPAFADAVVGEVKVGLLVTSTGYGIQYVNLGYRPGNEDAIRDLIGDPSGVSHVREVDQDHDYRYQQTLSSLPLTSRAPG